MIDKKSKYVKQPRKPGYYENDMEGFNYFVHILGERGKGIGEILKGRL